MEFNDLRDLDLLESLQKGNWWLQIKRLRALGFIEGNLRSQASLKVTAKGRKEIARLRKIRQAAIEKAVEKSLGGITPAGI